MKPQAIPLALGALLSISSISSISACGSPEGIGSELASTAAEAGAADWSLAGSGKPTTVSSGAYLTATRDPRKCAYPMCGGYFVSPVNEGRMRCWDGREARSCYVAELDLPEVFDQNAAGEVTSKVGFTDEHQVILRGSLAGLKGHPTYGVFLVSAAWVAPEPKELTAPVYLVEVKKGSCKPSGHCLFTQTLLNDPSQTLTIAEIYFYAAAGTLLEQEEANAALRKGERLIVAGEIGAAFLPTGHLAPGLIAKQFFTAVR